MTQRAGTPEPAGRPARRPPRAPEWSLLGKGPSALGGIRVGKLVLGVLAGLMMLALAFVGPPAARAAQQPAHAAAASGAAPSPTISPLPAGPPPGVRNPVEGALAILAIVIVAAAGIFIYIVIRKGL